MTLTTSKYSGTKIAEVMQSLESDQNIMDYLCSYNLPCGDVIEAIASAMVANDPTTVTVHPNGKVTTSDDEANND